MKSKSNPDFMKKEQSASSRHSRGLRSKVSVCRVVCCFCGRNVFRVGQRFYWKCFKCFICLLYPVSLSPSRSHGIADTPIVGWSPPNPRPNICCRYNVIDKQHALHAYLPNYAWFHLPSDPKLFLLAPPWAIEIWYFSWISEVWGCYSSKDF